MKAAEYASVFDRRKSLRSNHFVLNYRIQEGAPGARLGLVIAKRYLRRAVDRNLLKRLLREQFRLRRGEFPAVDFVFRLTAPMLAKAQKVPQRRMATGKVARERMDKRAVVHEISELFDKFLRKSLPEISATGVELKPGRLN